MKKKMGEGGFYIFPGSLATKESFCAIKKRFDKLSFWNIRRTTGKDEVMKPMTYKGYSSRIEYSDEDKCFVGRVFGIHDIITFHGSSVDELPKNLPKRRVSRICLALCLLGNDKKNP